MHRSHVGEFFSQKHNVVTNEIQYITCNIEQGKQYEGKQSNLLLHLIVDIHISVQNSL